MFRRIIWVITFLSYMAVNVGYADSDIEGTPENKKKTVMDMPFGLLGGKGLLRKGTACVEITYLLPNGLLKKAGFKVGDSMVSVNGRKFHVHDRIISEGGKGPQEDLGNALEYALGTKERVITIGVERDGEDISHDMTLPNVPPLGPDFPYDCARSAKMADDIAEWIKSKWDKGNARWNGDPAQGFTHGNPTVTSSMLGLMLLSTGNKKYRPILKGLAERFSTTAGFDPHLSNWSYFFATIYLCEYYLATADSKVLKPIKKYCDYLAKYTSPDGKHGHDKEVGYDGGGINIITSHIMLAWALAQKCGVEIDRDAWDRSHKQCERASTPAGALKYAPNAGLESGPARTSPYMVALNLYGGSRQRVKVGTKYIINTHKELRECHACTFLGGMMMGPGALLMGDKRGYRNVMNYFRWYLSLCTAPKADKGNAVYYCPGNGNNGGDNYLNEQLGSHAIIGLMLNSHKQKLFIHGGRKFNWFSGGGREESVVDFYDKLNPKTAIKELSAKLEEICSIEELPDTLKYLKKKRSNPGAKELYHKVLEEVDKDLDYIGKVSLIKPSVAYNRLVTLKACLAPYDKTLTKKVTQLMLTTANNSARTMAQFYTEFKLIKFPKRKQSTKQKVNKLNILKKRVDRFLEKKNVVQEVRFEAVNFAKKVKGELDSL